MSHSASTLPPTSAPSGPAELEALSLTDWIVLLTALGIALLVGFLIAGGHTQLALAVAAGIPLATIVAYGPASGLLLWLVVTPFFVQNSTSEATPMTWLLYRIAIPVMLILVLIYGAIGTRRVTIRLGLVDLALLAFLVFGAASVYLLTPNPSRTIVAFASEVGIPICLFWLVRAIGLTDRDLRRVMVVGAITIGIQVIVGAVSWFAPSILPGEWLSRAGERTTGTFGGPGPFSITIVLYSLLLIHMMLRDRQTGLRRLIPVGIVVAGLVAVFMTLSRGSWLGAGVAFLGLGLLYPVVVFRLAIAGAVLGAVLGFGILQEPFSSAQERLEDADTVADRLVTNQAALLMIVERPLVGFGYGNFERFDERYKARVGDIPLKVGGSSHNTYLNFAAEMGLAGFLLYFGAPVALMARTVASWKRLPRDGLFSRWLVFFLWLALIDQVLVSNFLEMIHGNTWGTLLWWLTLGLIAVVLDRLPARAEASGRFSARSGIA